MIVVIDWESGWESAEDILAFLTTLTPEIDLGVLFPGLDPGKRYRLIAVVQLDLLHIALTCVCVCVCVYSLT